ncbi:glycine betaine ABC transporter substrate-binding protein [Alkalibaculum sporogenes]|uniref:glycine betaine ABC transporter substrate-binding protein n=1 Tax=Alkalibaculum sporogenes TaxID=2655001 RepID=UPI001FE4AF4B|nr:glycine betaine ABC transporter substrate-binding protein [Alkalibaculum sporogenes]
MKKTVVSLLIVSFILAILVGCTKEEKKVVIASKPMTEQYIIVEMLTHLIEKNTDISVEQKMGIGGGTANIHPGMLNGEIDIYPEYTGTGWLFVLKEDLINDPMTLYEEVQKLYETEYDIIWSNLYGFNNTYGIAVKEKLVSELNLSTYSDLVDVSSELNLGAEYDFYEREDGYPGLESTYGFTFGEQTELDIGLKYEAIGSDKVDAINVFSTDGRLEEYNLVVLEDDKDFFPSYYAATLIRKETINKYPELEDVLAMLDDQINDEEMTKMNYLVEIEKQDPKVVAKEFLELKGLY